MNQGSILLLEDDEGLANLARIRLERQGYTVFWIDSPDKFDPTLAIDLVITDFQLEMGVTGLDFYTSLRASGVTVPAILITGYGEERLLIDALRIGVRDFVHKNDEFLEVLPFVVDRVMRDVNNERMLAEAARARQSQAEIEAALESANIGYWSIHFETGEIVWPHKILSIPKWTSVRSFLKAALLQVAPEERRTLRHTIFSAQRHRGTFEIPFQSADQLRWFRVKGHFEYSAVPSVPTRLVGMIWEETDKHTNEIKLARSLNELEQITERLKLAMMETHHRVKNSFQIVRSLMNMELRKEGFLSEDAVKKVISYVQGLSLIHDILTDNVKLHGSSTLIAVNELLDRLISTLQSSDPNRKISLAYQSPLATTARMASTLAVITTELLMNALKHGEGPITVSLERDASLKGHLVVANQVTDASQAAVAPSDKRGSTGLGLIEFLAKTDFKSAMQTSYPREKEFHVRIDFPIEP